MTALPALIALGALYAWGVRRARRPWPWWRSLAMAAGLLTLAVAFSDGLDRAADQRLSAHMVEHVLVGSLAPVLIALAAPVGLALRSLRRDLRRALGRALRGRVLGTLARPVVAFPLASAVTLVYHLSPPVFDAAYSIPLVHAIEHAALFWTALVCAMLVIGTDPLPHRPSGVGVVAWMSLPMIAMAGVGAAYSSWTTVHFAHYAGQAGALADQHTAGTVMWIGAAALVPATVLASWMALWREELRQRRRDAAMETSTTQADAATRTATARVVGL
jgi:cytochrome c oxidase assembly factor CtaG